MIRDYVAVLDARRARQGRHRLHRRLDRRPARASRPSSRRSSAMDDVLECHHVTGACTLMLKVKTDDTETLERVIDPVREIEGVTRTETMVVLSTHTERTRIALPVPEAAAAAVARRSGAAGRRAARRAGRRARGGDDGDGRDAATRRQGLYDPAYEHDACGVGFVANIRGETLARRGAQGHPGAREPRAPRRLRLRPGDRRRRRHPDPAARRASCAARRRALGIELPPAGPLRGRHGVPLAGRRRSGAWQRGALRARRRATRASACSAGATCPHDPDAIGRVAREGLPRIRQVFVGAAARPRPGRLRAQALRDRAASIEKRGRGRAGGFFYVPSLSSRTLVFPGMLMSTPDRALLPGPHRPGGRVGARARALALQHQHDAQLGRSRIRSATSRTTARSTRCAATATGCTRARARCARSCFGDDLQQALPDHARGRERLGAASTTCSSSWCSPGASCPRRS